MNKQLKILQDEVLSGKKSLVEAQTALHRFMHAYPEYLSAPVEFNTWEREVNKFDNEFELIIYGIQQKNQIAEVVRLIERVDQALKEKFGENS